MEYVSIFEVPPLKFVLLSILQTIAVGIAPSNRDSRLGDMYGHIFHLNRSVGFL